MCGFTGQIGGELDTGRALSFLRRRGPDAQNMWRAEDGAVDLLHCRLAIVDENSRADQPFRDPAHGIVVALNGEIYNYKSLWERYPDFAFRTRSDTEVIIAAYVREGIDGFKRLNGMFSFVLIDERAGHTILVRDTVGKKPLFVFNAAGAVLFGSSLLPLVACSGAHATIDPAAASFFWRRGYISPDMCAVAGARPVMPGAVLVFDRNGNEVSGTRLDAPASVRHGSEPEAEIKRTIRDLLVQAVERRLENNPQPVALLSGGVDSTIVAEITADRLRRHGDGRALKLLTLGAMVPYTQDEYFARFAAKRLGLPLDIVRPPRQRLPDAIRHAIALQDEPLGMPSYFFLFQLVAAAAPHGKVVLTGDGGDEVFLGYRPSTDWRTHALEPGYEASVVDIGPGASAWMGSWGRDATGNTLLGHMFTKLDRASAEQGVEIRCPLLDSDVIAYMRSLPPEISCRPSSLKPLLKDQLADWPQWFVERRKLGFAYNLRWHWALTRFADLREMVTREAIETFADRLPRSLRTKSQNWHTRDIFRHFSEAWRLMVWSAFVDRLAHATTAKAEVAQPQVFDKVNA